MKFSDIQLGQTFVTRAYFMENQEILDFAEKYDRQFLHLDAKLASEGPFGGIIASGFQVLSIVWGLFVEMDLLGPDSRGGIGLDEIRWRKPTYPGDTIIANVEISELKKTTKGDKAVIKFKFRVTNQHEEAVMDFTAIGLVAV